MSIKVMNLVWETELGSPTVKLVAMKMADCANDKGLLAWPSVRSIGRHTEVSDRTAQYALRKLCDLSVLRLVETGGGASPNVYVFDMATLKRLHAETAVRWEEEDKKRTGAKSAPVQDVRGGGASVAPEGCKACTQTIIEPPVEPKVPLPPRGDAQALEAFQAWNETAQRLGLPLAAKLTPDRKRRLLARLSDYGLDGWRKALENIPRSKFLRGMEGERNWRCTFDFLISPSGFSKVYDGSYTTPSKFATPRLSVVPKPPADDNDVRVFRAGTAEYEAALDAARKEDPARAAAIEVKGWVKCRPLARAS